MQLLTAQMARRLGRIAACYKCRISTNVNINAYLNSLNIKIRFHVHKQLEKSSIQELVTMLKLNPSALALC